MKLNLYPYNQYCLYAAIVLVVIALIMLGASLVNLAKAAMPILAKTEAMKKETEKLNEKTVQAGAFAKSLGSTLKNVFLGWIILSLLQKKYDEQDKKGLDGFANAVKAVMKDEASAERLVRQVSGIM